MKKKGGAETVTKTILLKEGLLDELRIKAFYLPITIFANIEIQKIAYYCGIGQRNSFGFGMIDILRSERLKMND
jgi:CRISPR-associated endoribonuclease Cas6